MFKRVHVLRLGPYENVVAGIKSFCDENGITSAVIVTMYGSFRTATLGVPPKDRYGFATKEYARNLSLLSGDGTISLEGDDLVVHIHVAVADYDHAEGGHLEEATVFGTVDVVIGELDEQLVRVYDQEVGGAAIQTFVDKA
jgi:predicted DNA-binding protein with PD1-like motif